MMIIMVVVWLLGFCVMMMITCMCAVFFMQKTENAKLIQRGDRRNRKIIR